MIVASAKNEEVSDKYKQYIFYNKCLKIFLISSKMAYKNNRTLTTLTEKLYLSTKTADVYFAIDNGRGAVERIPGHKYLLSAISDIFHEMFYGYLKKTGDVPIANVDVDTFKLFLKFAYFADVQLTTDSAMQLVPLGDAYNVINCFVACIDFLTYNVTSEKVCSVLKVALLYDQRQLEKACANQIAINTRQVFKTEDFLDCDKSILGYILRMDAVTCCEREIFDACLSWVRARSEHEDMTKDVIRKHLGDLFYQIRFTSMTVEEFARVTTEHGYVFTDDEVKDIVASSGCPKIFNGTARQPQWNDDNGVNVDLVLQNSPRSFYLIRNRTSTVFSSRKLLLLGTFSCCQIFFQENRHSYGHHSELPVTVKIAESNNLLLFDAAKTVLSEFKANLALNSTKQVTLPLPILIHPGRFYEISVRFPFVNKFGFISKETKDTVTVSSDVEIAFHFVQYDWRSDKNINFLTELMFNTVDNKAVAAAAPDAAVVKRKVMTILDIFLVTCILQMERKFQRNIWKHVQSLLSRFYR